MGTVNVNRNVTDMFYRYKMPRIIAKVEGKGNGIKTVIVNMSEIARALDRPPTYTTKYFGCELGAQTQIDNTNERFIINGAHDATKLQDLLDGFIRKYVLCPECDNPETNISTKQHIILQTCKACGFHGILKAKHKLNQFVLKNPPNMKPAAQGLSSTENKRAKRGQKKSGDNNVNSDNSLTNSSSGDSGCNVNNNADPTEAEINAAIPKMQNEENDDDDDDWSVDVSKEAIRARVQDLSDGAKGMTISDDYDKTEKERVDIFYEMVKKKRDTGTIGAVAVHKELFIEAERLDVVNKATLVLAELLFSENITQDARNHRYLLLRFTHNNQKAQRYLIGGLEQIIALHSAKLLNKTGGILKFFYDLDILEENAILEWSKKVSKKYVSKDISKDIHEQAKAFVKWLTEAEEEDSTENETESDIEIEYNDRAHLQPLKPAMVDSNSAKKINEECEDEGEIIDIDNI